MGNGLLVILAIVVLIAFPFLAIWSVNVLFGLEIAYTLTTWFAALFLSGIVGGARATTKR